MHELGLADAMLKMVKKAIADEGLTEVHEIVVELGDLCGVVPRFLSDCWVAVVDKTPFEKTVLTIKTVPGTLRCEDCQTEFTADLEKLVCPKCGSHKLTPLTGRDMTLLEIKAS